MLTLTVLFALPAIRKVLARAFKETRTLIFMPRFGQMMGRIALVLGAAVQRTSESKRL
jgi:hypothetical protein